VACNEIVRYAGKKMALPKIRLTCRAGVICSVHPGLELLEKLVSHLR
jgi:hypothetical protein